MADPRQTTGYVGMQPPELVFGPPIPTGSEPLDNYLESFRNIFGLNRAASKLRHDIYMGLGYLRKKESDLISKPYCFLQGRLREEASLTEIERQTYHEETNKIRHGLVDWRSLLELKEDENFPKILVEHFRDLAMTDLFFNGFVEYQIPPLVPGITKRAHDFLRAEAWDTDLMEAIRDLQASVKIGLKNALRIFEGKKPVEVPIAPVPPVWFLLRGLVRESRKANELERRAYREDMIEIRSGSYDYDYLIIATMENLLTYYPGEPGLKDGLLTLPPRTPSTPSLRWLVEGILTPTEVRGLKINRDFEPPEYLKEFVERKFYFQPLKGAALSLNNMIKTGISVIQGKQEIQEAPEMYLPYPIVFVGGQLAATGCLDPDQIKIWKQEMSLIALGRCDWEKLAENIRKNEEECGYGWREEKEILALLAERETEPYSPTDSVISGADGRYTFYNVPSLPSNNSSYSEFFRTNTESNVTTPVDTPTPCVTPSGTPPRSGERTPTQDTCEDEIYTLTTQTENEEGSDPILMFVGGSRDRLELVVPTNHETIGAVADMAMHRHLTNPYMPGEEESLRRAERWISYRNRREDFLQMPYPQEVTEPLPSKSSSNSETMHRRPNETRAEYLKRLIEYINSPAAKAKRAERAAKANASTLAPTSAQTYQEYLKAKRLYLQNRTEENRQKMTELGQAWTNSLPTAEEIVIPSVEVLEEQLNAHMRATGANTPQEPEPRSEGEGASEEDTNNNLANTGAIPKAPKKRKLRPQPPVRGAAVLAAERRALLAQADRVEQMMANVASPANQDMTVVTNVTTATNNTTTVSGGARRNVAYPIPMGIGRGYPLRLPDRTLRGMGRGHFSRSPSPSPRGMGRGFF
jgi:hypothetical protein